MMRRFCLISLVMAVGSGILGAAGAPTIASILGDQVSNIEREIVPLVQAMPADKFGFAPTTGTFQGVRTFAQQAKHVGAVIYMLSAAALDQKPPVDLGTGENGPDSVRSREQIVKFLQDAFAYAHKAAHSLTPKNELDLLQSPFGTDKVARAALVGMIAPHTFDHYGQMVVYLRMNGIIPPASR